MSYICLFICSLCKDDGYNKNHAPLNSCMIRQNELEMIQKKAGDA